MRVVFADTWFKRLVGLMFKKDFDGALVITMPFQSKINGIHTFFMKFPIDVYFLDKDLNLVDYVGNIKPWTSGVYPSKPAKYIVEVKTGNKLNLEEVVNKIKSYENQKSF